VSARGPFNGIMEHVAAPDGVTFQADTVGGISGWWARPMQARKGAAILHLHGGWFNWGTASAFRNLVGHIAMSAGADAFIPDYRLAPEHPFPAAVKDAEACFRGLVDRGIKKIALWSMLSFHNPPEPGTWRSDSSTPTLRGTSALITEPLVILYRKP
jgi:epsilon-lactone hydrolase